MNAASTEVKEVVLSDDPIQQSGQALTARKECMACVEKRLALEAVNEEDYEDPRRAFQPLDHSAGNYPNYWSESTNMSMASNAVSPLSPITYTLP